MKLFIEYLKISAIKSCWKKSSCFYKDYDKVLLSVRYLYEGWGEEGEEDKHVIEKHRLGEEVLKKEAGGSFYNQRNLGE